MTTRRLGPAIAFLTVTRFVVNTSHRFVYPFLPAITRGLGISIEQGGVLMSARSLAFVATPLTVATAGRGERRLRLAIVALGMMSVGALVTAASGVYAGAFVGFVLLGLGKPSYDAAAQAYIADRTPYERRARYMSILEITWAAGLLVGAPLAGWLIDSFGWGAPFWVVGIVFTMTMVAAPMFLDSDVVEHPDDRARLSLGWRTGSLLVIAALFSFAAETTFIVFGFWLEDDFALSLAALGLASTVVGLAEMAGEGSVLLFADRFGKIRMVSWGLAISAVGYAGLAAVSDSLVVGLLAVAGTFIAFEITIVAAIPLASELVPRARSRYLALFMVALGIGRSVGAVAGAWLYGRGGIPANALVSAVSVVIALGIVVAVFRGRDA